MKSLPSIESLKEYVSYDPATGRLTWRKATYRKGRPGEDVGTKRDDGYTSFQFLGRRILAHRAAWALMTGEWPTTLVDHRDGNPANNEWSNLRLADHSQNNSNTRGKDGECRVKNVYLDKRAGSYRVVVHKKGKAQYFGAFKDIEGAKDAAERARLEIHGDFARL